MQILPVIIAKTQRVPVEVDPGSKHDSSRLARQLDVVLLHSGFKLSGELLGALSKLEPVKALELSSNVVAACQHLIGDHVKHNVYFKNFPKGIPDTMEFWAGLISQKLTETIGKPSKRLLENYLRRAQVTSGVLNLLTLPGYGSYKHSYEEMLAAHATFIPTLQDRITVLHLGTTLAEEATGVFDQLIKSPIPLSVTDRELVQLLAQLVPVLPDKVLVRENKAVLDKLRLERGEPITVSSLTDVLRLAALLSGGDVTLETKFKFKSFKRSIRRALLEAIHKNYVHTKFPETLRHNEMWKRLGERLHSGEYRKQYPKAWDFFSYHQLGSDLPLTMRPVAAKVDKLMAAGKTHEVIKLLKNTPGVFFRNLDRLLVNNSGSRAVESMLSALHETAPKISGRVLLSVREHIENRTRPGALRIFSNRKGTSWTQEETRPPLDLNLSGTIISTLDEQVRARLPEIPRLLVDPLMLGVAIPLTDKYKPKGFGIMPRGSVVRFEKPIVRFFIYWKQKASRTDFDLSCAMLGPDFGFKGQVSYTNLRWGGSSHALPYQALHSGDITDATEGASEFIQVDLSKLKADYVLPQVNLYSGESFDEVEEGLFGFMELDSVQADKGKPFEPRLVSTKSELQGKQRVSLPLVFGKDEEGWYAKWLHLAQTGRAWHNTVESHKDTSRALMRSIVEREYVTVGYILNQLAYNGSEVLRADTPLNGLGPVTYIGLQAPEAPLHKNSQLITLENLSQITGFTNLADPSM